MGNDRSQRALSTCLWLVAVAAGLFLTYQRYMDAVTSDIGTDLSVFFAASRHALEGESVYSEPKYVYSPLVAWILAPVPDFETAIVVWTVISLLACWGAVAAVLAVLWPLLRPWQRPVIAGLGIVSLLFNNVTSVYLWFGQTDTLVLFLAALAVLLSARGRYASTGAVIALEGILKSWPGGLGLWLFRRGAPHRWRSVIAAVVTAIAFVIVFAVVAGPGTIVEWIERTLSFSSQPLVAYSVWGLGSQLFSDSGVMDPLVDAPLVGTVLGWTLAILVVALLAVALRWPESDSLSMWHVASGLILLIPVSHVSYRLLMLPLLWVWAAYAFRERGRWQAIAMTILLAAFWVLTFRGQTLDNRFAADTVYYVAVMAVALGAFAASVLVAAARDRRDRRELAPASGTGVSDPAASETSA